MCRLFVKRLESAKPPPSTRLVQQVHAVLRNALQAAVREELIGRNVARLVQVASPSYDVNPARQRLPGGREVPRDGNEGVITQCDVDVTSMIEASGNMASITGSGTRDRPAHPQVRGKSVFSNQVAEWASAQRRD
jgi:hypothetical protein